VRPLTEQTILVTGSTDGLGRRVAEELAQRGAKVLAHGRDPAKVERVAQEIGAERGLVADLGSLDDVRRLAGAVEELDTLVNNAGLILPERRESADGYELTFAVNYLSHFLLTLLLLPKLREPARVVNVASLGQQTLDFNDLMFERGWAGFPAYARSKLAQVLFSNELAERMADRDVTVNALHPATRMDTNMVRDGGGTPVSSVEEGVEATLRLIADPDLDGVSGRFFNGKHESATDPQADDPQARRRLWEESERLAGRQLESSPAAHARRPS
jgi:NAD(P)-dependent dehydrogenase (short-subunit alcohol dehydrogenase family)